MISVGKLRSPKRVGRGIRSSYELEHKPPRLRFRTGVARLDTERLASVREIPAPSYVVVDQVTGVLRAVWERVDA